MTIEEQWTVLVEDMTEQPDVTAGKMFGSRGLRIGKKFFAVLWDDRLVLKLPKARVEAVIASGGEPFMPMPGRTMGEWVVVGTKADWFALASESKLYLEALAAS